MQIDPVLQTTLKLAGYMASKCCLALQQGQSPGVDHGVVRADLGVHAEALATGFAGGALRRGRALLEAAPPGVVGQALLHAGKLTGTGSPFKDALMAEFDDPAHRLAGLVVALPYRPAQPGRRLSMHPVRVARCPSALLPFADDLLQCFVQGQMALAPGFAASMAALTLETRATPRPPARAFDPQTVALTIRADDASAGSHAKAAAHLDAFFEPLAFDGGLGFEKALRELELDFDPASLARVDALLDTLRAERQPQRDAFLDVPAGANFLHLVAVYLGETVARANAASAAWFTRAQFERVDPGRLPAPTSADSGLLCVFDGTATGSGVVFPALEIVMGRLFGAADDAAPPPRTLVQAAGAAGEAIRAARKPAPFDIGAAWRDAQAARSADAAAGELVQPRPAWAATDALGAWFDDVPALGEHGRVVWACLVQGGRRLFEAGDEDWPGEIVYHPRGALDPAELEAISRRVYALKGTRPRQPALAFVADALTHESTRLRGFPVPASLGAQGLLLSTIVFQRAHLPQGKLGSHLFPALIDDALPGLVSVLPSRYWPAELLARWRSPESPARTSPATPAATPAPAPTPSTP